MSYPWKNLSPKDGYIVRQTSLLSDVDQRIVTALYQPLIGLPSFSLYMVLMEECKSMVGQQQEKLTADLLSVLNIGVAEFYQARIRLEAVGLLRTYKKKNEESVYVYELHPPLSAPAFFADNVMSLLLLERVGEKRFQALRKKYVATPMEEGAYQDITLSFLEVFRFSPTKEQQNQLMQLNPSLNAGSFSQMKKPAVNIDSDTFDWSFFVDGLNKHFVKKESINEEAKAVILLLHEMYGLDELQLQKYVLEASDVESGMLDTQKLKNLVHQSLHNERKGSVSLTDKVQDVMEDEQTNASERKKALSQAGFTLADIAVIESSEENRPMTFLQSIKEQKGGFVTKTEQWTLEDIVSQSKLTPSVINILIHYILVVKNSPVFDRNLAYKIANDWAQHHISSPEEAMKKVKELRQTGKTRYSEAQKSSAGSKRQSYSQKNKTYRKETLPDWAKNDQPQKKEQVLSEKEQEAFRERLKKIRSYRKEGDQ